MIYILAASIPVLLLIVIRYFPDPSYLIEQSAFCFSPFAEISSVAFGIKNPEFERLKLMERKDMTDDEYDYYKSKSRQSTGVVVVDFVRLFEKHDESENIILRKNDVIYVPQQKDYIIMLGQFVNPGKIIFNSSLRVSDYIQLAGGFGWRAQEGDVRVIKAKTGEWLDADDDVLLQPGDTIWAPEEPQGRKFWAVFTEVLSVVAQVAAILAASAAVIIATR